MTQSNDPLPNGPQNNALGRDLMAGLIVFLVALPLCLGIAAAAGAPLISGILAGVIGGLVVGALSGSHTSVSGPGNVCLTAMVIAMIASLGFQGFLLAVVLAGVVQIGMGVARAGSIAAFIPSSVIKGLLAAIGIILILKQIPHVLGHDPDPEGDLAFWQPDRENTFTALFQAVLHLFYQFEPGATLVGLLSLAILLLWDRANWLKKSPIPAPLVVVLMGVALSLFFRQLGKTWEINESHLVQVPVARTLEELRKLLTLPDFTQWANPAIYQAAVTLAAVASLETLLNLEAVDKIDPQQRSSPPNRELIAQGVGNMVSGLLGGLPITSVIVRSSVNVTSGGRTWLATVFHGLLLLLSVAFLPTYLNLIPLSCLAAILLVTGIKLASPAVIRQMWKGGWDRFAPFAVTVLAIVFTDLLTGVLIGLGVALGSILWSNLQRPLRLIEEKHLGGDVVHIELANQVSFLSRAALSQALDEVPKGGHVLIDAQYTDYIDPDVLDLIRDYEKVTAPARGVVVSLIGFKDRYKLADKHQYVDYSTRELQEAITPQQVMQVLMEGNERFRNGQQLTRNYGRQVSATAAAQHPLACILNCIDSRTPAELIFDMGVGDVFSVRVAGNVSSRKVLGSIEYACAVAGVKLVLVMGHTRCGAVTAAVNLVCEGQTAAETTGCQHLDRIVEDIQPSIDSEACREVAKLPREAREPVIDDVARRNVRRVVEVMLQESQTLAELAREGKIAVVGAMYDVTTGEIEMLTDLAPAPTGVVSAR